MKIPDTDTTITVVEKAINFFLQLFHFTQHLLYLVTIELIDCMNRRNLLKTLTTLSLFVPHMKLNSLEKLSRSLSSSDRMPVLFLGHGSPMNAIEENEFVRGFRKTAAALPPPKAILCVSAHWETQGTFVTAMAHPRTIHDFGGFPQALFDVQYPAPGNPKLAEDICTSVQSTEIKQDHHWGLDHGAWSVITHLYPDAHIPVVQMSIDRSKGPDYHYQLAQQLAFLRRKGVLIIGSGNMVHNLRKVAWNKLNEVGFAFDWAREAQTNINNLILSGNHRPLIQFEKQGIPFQLSIPTPEHYLPLLYTLALQEKDESPDLFNDNYVAGAISMTSLKIS